MCGRFFAPLGQKRGFDRKMQKNTAIGYEPRTMAKSCPRIGDKWLFCISISKKVYNYAIKVLKNSLTISSTVCLRCTKNGEKRVKNMALTNKIAKNV